MPDAVLPLDNISRQIAEHESHLRQLRREYKVRQKRLAVLAREKKKLQNQLKRVELAIHDIKGAKPTTAAAPKAAAAKPTTQNIKRHATLKDLLIDMARRTNRPVTIKILAQEVVRQKFPTTSRNIPNLVGTRVKDLIKRGIFRRAANQPGVVLNKVGAAVKPALSKNSAKKKSKSKPKSKVKSTKSAATNQPSLRMVILDLLKNSSRPLKARELAEQAVAGGYKSKSKSLTDVVWTAISDLPNIENVPGQGYRLKQK